MKIRQRLTMPRRFLPVAFAVALVFGLIPLQVQAADLRQGPSLVIGATETIDDDLYAAGGTVDVEATVNGSVIAGGGTVTIGGTVNRDVLVGGGTVNITGDVKGSIRAAGGNLTISGPVAGDVVVTGGMVTLQSRAGVGRDVLLGAGSTTIAGPVTRNVRAGGGDLTINAAVGGDVQANVNTLHLGNGAAIQGKVTYRSDNQATVDSGAKVQGGLERQAREASQPPIGVRILRILFGWLRALVGLFALGLILVLVVPGLSQRTVATLQASPWASLGLGVLLLIVVPIVALLVFVGGIIVGGWWLGVFLLVAYALALLIGYARAGLLTGDWIVRRLNWSGLHPVWPLLVGLVILTLIGLIPILGGIVSFIVALLGFGAFALTLARPRPAAGGRAAAV